MMVIVAYDREGEKELIRERRERGLDRFDEVWDGVYIMSPLADVDHQFVGSKFVSGIDQSLDKVAGARVFGGVNVSDRIEKWTKNFRCPDVAVFLPGNPAKRQPVHYCGGPDFAIEVLSPGDRARKKFGFYAKIGTREVLLVCRKPWALELYRLADGELKFVGKIGPDPSQFLKSEVLPISLRLLPGDPRPTVEVTQTEDARTWLI